MAVSSADLPWADTSLCAISFRTVGMPFHRFYYITRGKKGPIISTFPALFLQNLHTKPCTCLSALHCTIRKNCAQSPLLYNPSLDLKGVWLMESSGNRLKLLFFPFCLCEDLCLLHKILVHPVLQDLPHAPHSYPAPGRLNLSLGWLYREGTKQGQSRGCSGPQSMEKGQVGPTCSTAAGGHRLMAPGEHINMGINAERLTGSVNITGEKHAHGRKEANNSSSVGAGWQPALGLDWKTGDGSGTESRARWNSPSQQENVPSLYLMVNHDPIPFPYLLLTSMTFYLLGQH